MSATSNMIAINVGNTRTAIARFEDGRLAQSQRFTNGDPSAIVHAVAAWCGGGGNGGGASDGSDAGAGAVDAAIVVASVNDPLARALIEQIERGSDCEVYRVGEDVPVPIGQQLDPETLTGVDRLLNAAAAFDTLKQACVIVDAGTAVTVDFVDGQGTFHGGAIAPGASLQLQALHQHTAALPELAFREPDHDAFGRNTAQAMYHGVFHGIRGMVQRLVEQYAEAYGAFPMVVATGGDAQTLFHDEPLVDRIVPDLTLMGIAVAARLALADEGAEN